MFKSQYFKGWYFKCSGNGRTIAFIPAYHRSGTNTTSSLQIITDKGAFNISGNYLEYSEKPLCIKFENCVFSENGVKIDIENDNLTFKGELKFGQLLPIKYPIMGPFRFVPFMQCSHSVYSMKHNVSGQMNVGGELLDFQNGIGYIEGDSGSSFPKKYVWTQCCYKNCSLMLSVADIPLSGIHFTGIIGVVMIDKKEYRIATYLGAKLIHITDNTVLVKQGDYEFYANLIEKNAQPLYAPIKGEMKRTIHESPSCKAYYRFSHRGEVLIEFVSDRASFEFEYN
ncbi:MAG: hypothetical protein ACI3XA_02760 [Clostridia bacterium]